MAGQSAVTRPEGIFGYNGSKINGLPTTSPHGSDFGQHAQILGLASDPNAMLGTATASCTCVATWGEPRVWGLQKPTLTVGMSVVPGQGVS